MASAPIKVYTKAKTITNFFLMVYMMKKLQLREDQNQLIGGNAMLEVYQLHRTPPYETYLCRVRIKEGRIHHVFPDPRHFKQIKSTLKRVGARLHAAYKEVNALVIQQEETAK